MDQQRDTRVVDKVDGLLRGGVGGHYYRWMRCEGCAGEIGVVHEGDVGEEVGTSGEVELRTLISLTIGNEGAQVIVGKKLTTEHLRIGHF